MNLDEFNLVCYASMYGLVEDTIIYLKQNRGNLFEKYVSTITVTLNLKIKLIMLVD